MGFVSQRDEESIRAGVAGVVERETLLELASLGLPLLLVCPTRERGPGGVLSECVGGALDVVEVVDGVPSGTLLLPGRPWLQT